MNETAQGVLPADINDCCFSLYKGPLGYFVRSIGHFCHFPPKRSRIKHAQFGEIFWCLQGEGIFRDQLGKTHTLGPGQVWYYPPGSLHNYIPSPQGFHYRWLSIDGPDTGALFSGLGIKPGLMDAGQCPESLFHEIAEQITLPNRQLELLNSAFQILLCVARQNAASQDTPGSLASRARQCQEKNYQDPNFNLNILAQKLGRHRITVARCFQKEYGMHFSEYLSDRRCQEALRLLMTEECKVSSLPQRCGFSSMNYLIRVIRHKTGKTPGALRKQMNRMNT
ncbi:MAG: helix-turn-helix transcriptional regulator [Victivallales bacterium]|nr:helix-turn-helix transcriptional regulator [Victivallales bacterium]